MYMYTDMKNLSLCVCVCVCTCVCLCVCATDRMCIDVKGTRER